MNTTAHAFSTNYVTAYNTELKADLTAALVSGAAVKRRRREKKR